MQVPQSLWEQQEEYGEIDQMDPLLTGSESIPEAGYASRSDIIQGLQIWCILGEYVTLVNLH